MDPTLFVALVVKVGIPLAEELLAMIHVGAVVTPELWDKLKQRNATKGEDLVPPRTV